MNKLAGLQCLRRVWTIVVLRMIAANRELARTDSDSLRYDSLD
jgi:hypothetical protein